MLWLMRHRECLRFFHQNVPAIIFEAFLLWCFFNIRQDSGLVFLVNNYDLAPRSVNWGREGPGGWKPVMLPTHGLAGVDGVSWTAPVACRDLRLWGGLWQLLVFSKVQAFFLTPCRTCILIKSRNLQGFSVIQYLLGPFRDGVLIRCHVSDVLGVYDQHSFFFGRCIYKYPRKAPQKVDFIWFNTF